MPFPSRTTLEGPSQPTHITYLACLRANSSGAQLWPVTCTLASVGALWGSLDGVARNYHTGLGAMRGALNLGAATLGILTLRDFVFAPAKVYLQHRAPAYFPLALSNLDPARASPRLHNLPEMALAGATAGLAIGNMSLGATALQYLGNELYYQQIRYIRYRNEQILARAPLVTLRQRVKDVMAGVVDRFFGLGIGSKIPDEQYLLDQEVQLELLKEEQEEYERELARLQLLYTTLEE